MSGQNSYSKDNKEGLSRRSFLYRALAAAGILGLSGTVGYRLLSPPARHRIKGSICGTAAATGHRLREARFPEPSAVLEKEYVIVGGGVAGLSAARWLKKSGIDSFTLLELDSRPGGNSAYGSNEITEYPWGAHYITLPGPNQQDLLAFLEETEVITGYDSRNRPIYNEYYICFDPQERLFINGRWQEGLVPVYGVPAQDMKQINRFFELMNGYKAAKGKDGRDAFIIPISECSEDTEYTQLDRLSMKEFLLSHDLRSEYLHWYVGYCCRDDFGCNLEETSAWAGIHYFASRKGEASNADANHVLTWPEGNGWLVKQLEKPLHGHILTNTLAYSVSPVNGGVQIDYYDAVTGSTSRILAKKCIMAVPQFINRRILHADRGFSTDTFYNSFTYSPWMVATIILRSALIEDRGFPLCWDNVFYGSTSLGYINAGHQHLNTGHARNVLSYYLPLADEAPAAAREKALKRSHAEWVDRIVGDLEIAHPGIADLIDTVDVWIWGHGMIRPVPGFVWSQDRKSASRAAGNIFFAHSDLSGYSIFEEAFRLGIEAARQAIRA
jgi:hypothetical protein